ncbi:hypothetical protein BLNAU_4826 [Blattamonas nauphoetae]|uniref:Uncharacterized protein n=1 Tax=Blattamonas nauphoetae TaxID=2049346 RepID=A0ABQ9Y941_9EUKA|nr:hypothetical protein BLNAU_4826 [Blattamonas nauphoetae]
MESKDRTIAEQKQQLAHQTELEHQLAEFRKKEELYLSTLNSMQMKDDQLRKELAMEREKRKENERVMADLKQTSEQMKTEVARKERFFVSSDTIVAFSPNHCRVSGSTVTRINTNNWAGCFTKPVSKGIHRLSIRTQAEYVMFGVCDAAVYPQFLTSATYQSPKAALMYNYNGYLFSAGNSRGQNTIPQKGQEGVDYNQSAKDPGFVSAPTCSGCVESGESLSWSLIRKEGLTILGDGILSIFNPGQEWSAEADLEKRTLHFFIDGVQQPLHFISIPVPLVFAIDSSSKDIPIEITFWGEETQSHVTFQGTGHNLG